jgi:hypothetical protein
MIEKYEIDKPLNAMERYLYNLNIKMDVMIDMLNSLIEFFGKQYGVATTKNVVQDFTEKVKTRKKG